MLGQSETCVCERESVCVCACVLQIRVYEHDGMNMYIPADFLASSG